MAALTRFSTTFAWLVLLVLLPRPAQAQVSKEYQLKAVCLWRLAQFVDWPTNAFERPDSPVVIGVLGENPFGDALKVAVRDETAHGRRLVVRHYQRIDEIRSCHIVFMAKSESRRISETIGQLAGRSILTVSDISGFVGSYGGMVALVTEQNRIRLRVNPDAAAAEHLVLDAKLLRIAEVVRNQ
jgi:hypothetical protein